MIGEPHILTVAEAARLIERRALSPVELTRAFLERIAQHRVGENIPCGRVQEPAGVSEEGQVHDLSLPSQRRSSVRY